MRNERLDRQKCNSRPNILKTANILRSWIIGAFFIIGIAGALPSTGAAPSLDNKWLSDPVPNSDMVYRIRPNSEFTTLGVSFQTNELGFRDRPTFKKGPGVFRILCLGDSVTFGTGVRNDQTFPNVLEGMLQEYASPGVTFDVINGGVSAYNIRNIRGLLEQTVGYLRPDAVVYTFVENDLDDSVSVGPGGWLYAYDPAKSPDEPFIADDFPAIWLIRRDSVAKKSLFGSVASLFDNRLEVASDTPPPLLFGSHPETNRRWREFEENLSRMNQTCRTAGVPLLVYSFGMRNHSEPLFQRVGAACQNLGVPAATTLPIFDRETYANEYSLGYDAHCNPRGHQRMAGRLLCFLQDRGTLPPQLSNAPLPHTHYTENPDPAVAKGLEQQALNAPRVIDVEEGEGALGILGGIEMEGKLARYCLLRLSGPGDRIEVTLSALLATPDQPQTVSAEIEGRAVGTPVFVPRSPVRVTFKIPEDLRDQTIEIKLIAGGPAWIPSPEERLKGATPQTLQIKRVERKEVEDRIQS